MGLISRLLGKGADGEGEGYAYPLDRTQERTYDDAFEGDVYVWDIDKTYLASEFDSLKGLLSVPLEFAVDKRNVAGTDVLLRALRRGCPEDGEVRSNPLYFVSASPPQLRGVLERKMQLDGVEYDGITFKDQFALLRHGRVAALKHHVGYKLSALLLNRHELPWGVRETAFGDDSETDVLIYGLYADIVAGRLRGDTLERTLRKNEVEADDARYVAGLADGLPCEELVDRIYINLEHRSPPAQFAPWGRRVVPCYDAFQMALHLWCEGKIRDDAALDVGRELVNSYQRQPLGLLRGAFDLVERGAVGLHRLRALWPALVEAHLVPGYVALVEAETEPAAEANAPRDFVTPARHLALS